MISTTLPDGKPLAEEPGAQNDEVVGITLRGTRVMIPGKPDKIVPPTRIFRVMMNSVVLTERFLKTGRLVFGRDFLECIVKEEGKPPRWTWELLLEDGMVVLELRNERDGREKNPNSI